MKFAHYLSVLERDAPAQWTGKFIRYKQLKKMIKACIGDNEAEENDEQPPKDSTDSPVVVVNPDAEAAFFDELRSQLNATNAYFQMEADKTIQAFQRTQSKKFLCCFFTWSKAGPHELASLAEHAYWCRKFARANAVALRKILKKHDKNCANSKGRQFLEDCWKMEGTGSTIGLFLHSPLLDELKAIQDVLQEQLSKCTDEDVQPLDIHASAMDDIDGSKGGEAPSSVMSLGQLQREEQQDAISDNDDNGDTKDDEDDDTAAHNIDNTNKVINKTDGGEGSPSAVLHTDNNQNTLNITISHSSQDDWSASGADHDAPGAAPNGSLSSSGITGPTSTQQHSGRQSQRGGLTSIIESPTCMLDTSDYEWGGQSDVAAARGLATSPPSMSGLSDTVGLPPRPKGGLGAAISARSKASSSTSNIPFPPPLPTTSTNISGQRQQQEQEASPQKPPVDTTTAQTTKRSIFGNRTGSSFNDEDLKCPICLEFMYKPVGLGCGHKFCRPCALEAAGFGFAKGAFFNIITHIPPTTVCPQCRQPRVYRSAVSLKELGALIKKRHPKDWEERRKDEKLRGHNPQPVAGMRHTGSNSALETLFPDMN